MLDFFSLVGRAPFACLYSVSFSTMCSNFGELEPTFPYARHWVDDGSGVKWRVLSSRYALRTSNVPFVSHWKNYSLCVRKVADHTYTTPSHNVFEFEKRYSLVHSREGYIHDMVSDNGNKTRG